MKTVANASKEKAIQAAVNRYVRLGGRAENGLALLLDDVRLFAREDLIAALVYRGFSTQAGAVRMAAALQK